MPNRLNAYSPLAAGADQLRQIVAERHAARIAQEQAARQAEIDAAKAQQQQFENDIKSRQVAVSERPPAAPRRDPIRMAGVTDATGRRVTRFADPETFSTLYEVPEYEAPKEPTLVFQRRPDGSEVLVERKPGLVSAPPPRAPRAENYTTTTMQDENGNDVLVRVNPNAGIVEPMNTGGLRPRPQSAAGPKPATGEQRVTVGFFNRMKEAIDIMDEVEDKVSSTDLTVINDSPLFESINFRLLSPAGQRYARALKQYTEARLRKESGAAIPPAEYDSDRQVIARQSADDPTTLEDRRRSRRTTLVGFGSNAGPAYEDFYGVPFDQSEHEYVPPGTPRRQRSASATPPPPAPRGSNPFRQSGARPGQPAAAPASGANPFRR